MQELVWGVRENRTSLAGSASKACKAYRRLHQESYRRKYNDLIMH